MSCRVVGREQKSTPTPSQHVEPQHDTVKCYCPKCGEAYVATGQLAIDGAYFGPTFPHLFFMTYGDEVCLRACVRLRQGRGGAF